MSLRYIVPALAVAGRAAASCSVSGTTTISSSADAAALTTCTTFSGSIAIATGTTDDIALDGITTITGSLIADNVTEITQISADSLTTITDSFTLSSLTILSSLSFPVLTDVGTISWITLPALQGLSFTDGVQTASELNIQDTQLTSLDGIDLAIVDTVYITNNAYLEDISMQLGNISDALTIEANGDNVSVVLPNLIWANNMTLRNVTTFTSASLEVVNGSFGFYDNSFATITCANLTTVGGSLSFVSNTDLTNVSMPILKTVDGGLQIANNTKYTIVDGFADLATVGGAIDLTGDFTSVTFPSLSDVKGAFYLKSTADCSSSCTTFKKDTSIIKGKITCDSTDSSASSSSSGSSSGTASSSSSSSTSTKSSGASDVVIPSLTGFMGVVAVMFGLM